MSETRVQAARAEQIVYLTDWAARWGASLQLAGEVGFGRDCTGIMKDGHYIDTREAKDANAYTEDGEWWQPEDAYHKHDCLAVLGHGDGPLAQLHEWVRWLDGHGWGVGEESRRPSSDIDLFLHGVVLNKLVRMEAANPLAAGAGPAAPGLS